MIPITQEGLAPFLLEDGKTIMTTLTNHGYLLYTLNMLKSLRPYGLDQKVLIICMDEKSVVLLRIKGYHAVCVDHATVNRTLAKFCPWNTKGYDQICYVKLELIHRLLTLHANVVLMDGDIVFQKDPLADLRHWMMAPKGDVWIQNDAQVNTDLNNMCTGYLFIKSNDTMITLYDCVSEAGKAKYKVCAMDNNDQSYFNKFVKPYCAMNALPLEKYPNGKMFYDHVEQVKNTAVLVHFNWIRGHQKMAKMKEHKMWLLTEEEEDL